MIDIVSPDLRQPEEAAKGRPQASGHRHQWFVDMSIGITG
jgi:hypothetical protein